MTRRGLSLRAERSNLYSHTRFEDIRDCFPVERGMSLLAMTERASGRAIASGAKQSLLPDYGMTKSGIAKEFSETFFNTSPGFLATALWDIMP
jgi:hypothetical protein